MLSNRDLIARPHKRSPRDPHNPLPFSAARPRRQVSRFGRDVFPNDREVAAFKLQNVRAILATRAGAQFLRRRSDAANELHDSLMTIVISLVKSFLGYAFDVARDKSRERIVSEVVRLLKTERERQGLSMNKLAERTGLSQSTVSLIERDLRNPTLEVLLRFAAALDVDLWRILKDAESRA